MGQRYIALFMLSLFWVSILVPTASALGAEYQQNQINEQLNEATTPDTEDASKKEEGGTQHKPENTHIKKTDDAASNKPMKQNYPKGTQAEVADEKAAPDAQATGSNSKDVLAQIGKREQNAPQGPMIQQVEKPQKADAGELVEQRTATTSTELNEDGSLTKRTYMMPKYYKKSDGWATIHTELSEDKNAGDSGNWAGKAWGNARSWFSKETTYTVTDNDWKARFAPSDFEGGMLRVKKGDSQIGFVPQHANKVDPVITKKNGKEVVHYYNLWDGVDVEYVVQTAAVKENIIIKNKQSVNSVTFKMVGASLKGKKGGNHGYEIKGALSDDFGITPANLVLNKYGLEANESVFSQTQKDNQITLAVDKEYLKKLPKDAFPAVIDPGVFTSNFGNRAGGTYMSFMNNGYVCGDDSCNVYAGGRYDSEGVARMWRGALFVNYDQFRNAATPLTYARLHLNRLTGVSFFTGDGNPHTYSTYEASCLNGWNCMNTAVAGGSASIANSGDINVTNIYQQNINQGDFGAWVMVKGDESNYSSFANFNPEGSYVEFTYGGQPTAPSFNTPTKDGQVYVDPQPSFGVNPVSNPNSSTVPLQYEIMVSTSPAAAGTLITSGKMSARQWTMPDGILQDGSTYYVQSRTFDPVSQTYSPWGTSLSFRIDMRTGKDKTQTFDTLGPVDVDLATGNVMTSNSSHNSKALGGDLGISLDYNTPLKSRNGLVGQYWNNTSFSGSPLVTRVDQAVDFSWEGGSADSSLPVDSFGAKWTGYFVAPAAGTYSFGAINDDSMNIKVNNTTVYNNAYCWPGPCYDTTTVTLTAGQIVPIEISYTEATGNATAKVYVKGAVPEQVLPSQWLQTGVRPLSQQNGLVGRYYNENGSHDFNNGNTKLFMQRTDPLINFYWGLGSPLGGANTDNFMVRWTGYFTPPTTGSYTFGTSADDGSRITVGTSNTQVLNTWQNNPGNLIWGSAINLTAGVPVPITVDYFENGGGAAMTLKVKGAVPEQVVPSTWLSPKAQVLPDGWNMGLDPDGDIGYDHIKVNPNSVVLTDSTGDTHEYTWTGSGYKPPVNEDGQLTRNSDGTYKFEDIDGRTYVFLTDGNLSSVTSAVDDRKPAALQYEYQGNPAHLYKIKDAVDPSRNATLYYSGQSECGTAPSGFDSAAPGGMLCALGTNDGRFTYFYYINGQLARIQEPGSEITDYRYEAVQNNGATIGYRINKIRDVMANDAIAAGVRVDDDTATTQLSYDILGRATSVTQPAANAGDVRTQHTVEFLPGALDKSYYGASQQHIVGSPEPNGFTRRVEYDTLFRTIKDSDVANLTDTTEWDATKDLTYSSTDEAGLKSTTIYDDEDRAVTSYGPAPAAWFDASNAKNQVPLASYASQVPRTDTTYDGGITGLAVTYMAANTNTVVDTLWSGQTLAKGQWLWSLDRRFGFAYQTDGNLVLYGPNGVMWASNTTGKASTGLAMQGDGNLVLYNNGSPVWATGSGGGNGGFVIQNDGNAVIYNSAGASWATHTTGSYNPSTYRISLTGAPLQHATNIATDGTISKNFGTGSPVSGYSGKWGMTMTGKMRLPQSGVWNFRVNADGGVRVWIDDVLRIDDWAEGNGARNRSFSWNEGVANTPHRVKIDYFHTGRDATSATFNLFATAPGGSETAQTAQYFSPDYNLTTSTKTYDSTLGNTVTATNFGANPELGLPQSTTTDAGGLNLTTSTTYEQQGATGSFLRKTAKYLPGANTADASTATRYAYYGATETRDNPCTTSVTEAYKQGGMMKLKTEPDPDGTGSKTARAYEVVYDDAGREVATRYNSESWECTTFDTRGRETTVVTPAAGNEPARTVTNNYAVGGNPTVQSNTDFAGTITTWTDLLGRTIKYSDAYGDETTTTYDNFGKLLQRVSPIGTETYEYDNFNRLAVHKLDGVTYATVTYSANGRVDYVDYNNAGQMRATMSYDNQGRNSAATYRLGDGTTTVSDSVNRSQSGQITSGTIQSGSNQLAYTYGYDSADRVTSATVGANTYSYGFGAQDSATCGTGGGTNANAGKNSNRTTQTVNGVTTKFCYDYADRLIGSSDSLYSDVQYDAHGNMTHLGTPTATSPETYFYYDSRDRSGGYEQYDYNGNGVALYYDRDNLGRIIARYKSTIADWNWTTAGEWFYHYTGTGDTPDYVRDSNWDIIEKTMQLPGGVNITLKPKEVAANNKKQYSLPNIHGDTLLTSNAVGANTSNGSGPANSFAYDPFGNAVTAGALPANTAGASYGWVGKHEKITENAFVLTPVSMGARIYLPSIGRFTQVDPIEGGVENNYIYPADPVNEYDLTGEAVWIPLIMACIRFCRYIPKAVSYARKIVRIAPKVYRVAKSIRLPAVNRGKIVFKATYNSAKGQKRFIKLDKPDKYRPFFHWVKGRVNGKGNEKPTGHYRWWGKRTK
jgi:RHS repeat-associated protein